jgi:hypothetical protein
MLAVAPPSAMRLDVGIRTFLEGHRLGSIEPGLQPLGSSRLDGVDAVMPSQSMLPCPLTRLCQADGVQRPHAHPPRAAVEHEAENPIFRAVGRDAQIKPATVAVHAGLVCLIHLECRELADYPCHFYAVHNFVRKPDADYDEGWRTCPEQKGHG